MPPLSTLAWWKMANAAVVVTLVRRNSRSEAAKEAVLVTALARPVLVFSTAHWSNSRAELDVNDPLIVMEAVRVRLKLMMAFALVPMATAMVLGSTASRTEMVLVSTVPPLMLTAADVTLAIARVLLRVRAGTTRMLPIKMLSASSTLPAEVITELRYTLEEAARRRMVTLLPLPILRFACNTSELVEAS